MTLKKLACEKFKQYGPTGLNVFEAMTQFSVFKQPKCHTKMVALMLPLLAEASTEEKMNTLIWH